MPLNQVRLGSEESRSPGSVGEPGEPTQENIKANIIYIYISQLSLAVGA